MEVKRPQHGVSIKPLAAVWSQLHNLFCSVYIHTSKSREQRGKNMKTENDIKGEYTLNTFFHLVYKKDDHVQPQKAAPRGSIGEVILTNIASSMAILCKANVLSWKPWCYKQHKIILTSHRISELKTRLHFSKKWSPCIHVFFSKFWRKINNKRVDTKDFTNIGGIIYMHIYHKDTISHKIYVKNWV